MSVRLKGRILRGSPVGPYLSVHLFRDAQCVEWRIPRLVLTYWRPSGGRGCRACKRAKWAAA